MVFVDVAFFAYVEKCLSKRVELFIVESGKRLFLVHTSKAATQLDLRSAAVFEAVLLSYRSVSGASSTSKESRRRQARASRHEREETQVRVAKKKGSGRTRVVCR